MKKVLLSKLKNLVRGDDGAALVITLGVFFFMYIFCAGVYAIGFAVKEKIHLQNACDAAAYSAAVVQADTISRIATLNRAMGWTYAQMCKRQMDYIVYRWLEHAVDHYEADAGEAAEHMRISFEPKRKHEGVQKVHGGCWISPGITLNGHRDLPYTPKQLEACYLGLSEWNSKTNKASMYKTDAYDISGLELQIYYDKKAIRDMNDAFDDYLDSMTTRVDNAVEAILRANIPAYMANECRYVIKQELNPNKNLFEKLGNSITEEEVFVGWGGGGDWSDEISPNLHFRPYGPGSASDEWFVLTTDEKWGLQRSYNFNKQGALVAEWSWWSWFCPGCANEGEHVSYYHKLRCNHGWNDDRCRCSEKDENKLDPKVYSLTKYDHSSFTYADSSHLMAHPATVPGTTYGYYYEGQRAYPRKLKREYFGPNGTITVGLVKRNTNPFYSVFRSAMESGFYSAFRPYNDWTWCFSSAKAGYKLYALQEEETADGADSLGWEARHNGRARAFRDERDYCIDWKLDPTFRSNNVTRRRELYYWDEDDEKWKFFGYDWEIVQVKTEADIPKYETNGWTTEYDKGHRMVLRKGPWKLEREPNGRLARHGCGTNWRHSWNLTQSDWDAVLLPVRQGGSTAEEVMQGHDPSDSHLKWMKSVRDKTKFYSYEPLWKDVDELFVSRLVASDKWKDLSGAVSVGKRFGDMFAGGAHDPDPNGDWGENFIEKTSAGWNGWWDITKTAADHPEDQSEKVQCRWNIGTPHGTLKWKEVSKLMFH